VAADELIIACCRTKSLEFALADPVVPVGLGVPRSTQPVTITLPALDALADRCAVELLLELGEVCAATPTTTPNVIAAHAAVQVLVRIAPPVSLAFGAGRRCNCGTACGANRSAQTRVAAQAVQCKNDRSRIAIDRGRI
jgi:hypothetical protein